jgi:hypothetical protein
MADNRRKGVPATFAALKEDYDDLRIERDARLAERDRLREALEMTICHGCSNRIGFTGEGFVRDGNEWRKCPNCRKARAALSGKEGE